MNETSRNEDTATVKQPEDMNRRSKVLVVAVSIHLAVVFCFFIYKVATELDRHECQVCKEANTIIPAFVRYTSWCFITTCANWTIYVWRRFFVVDTSSSSQQSNLPALFRLSLPLSVVVSLAYTLYLATNNWGRDMVDDELCYTLATAGIPKEGTSRAAATVFLGFYGVYNITVHYLCAAINLALYFKASKRGDWQPFAPLCFVIVQSIMVVLVQEFVDDVYCTDAIILDCALTTLVFGVLHAVFFCRKKKATTDSLEIEDEVASSIS